MPHLFAKVAGLAIASALTLTACSSGTTGSRPAAGPPGAASSAGSVPPAAGLAKAGPVTATQENGAGASASIAIADRSRMLARQATLTISVKDVTRAASEVRSATTAAGGLVVSEDIGTGSSPDPVSASHPYGTLTVQVPAAHLDATLDQLSRLGTVLDRTTSAQDVKSQYVDTSTRLATQRASVARVQALMSRATKLADVVNLEGELSKRQADLEALEAELASLKDSVAMSPVTVQLTTAAVAKAHAKDAGFVAGLHDGWRAFQSSVTGVLTVVGAFLPFGALVALIGFPILWWVRRHRRLTPATVPVSAEG